ncbi:MAG: GNAT family N-acetyltransferase [Rhizorhabdus sp.]
MDGPAIVIRRAGLEDAAALSMIGAASFLESYAHMIGIADMVAHNGVKNSSDAWRGFARDPDAATWIAEMPVTGVPIGYALLTAPDLPIDLKPEDIELRRIYLLSKWQRGGLGRRLIEQAIGYARAMGKRRFLIGVYSENEGAIAFYRRMGCDLVGTRTFQVGDATFNDLIFGMNL